jgi:magnesium transporter
VSRSKRQRRPRTRNTGAAPGTAAYVGPLRDAAVVIRIHRFDLEHHRTLPNADLADVLSTQAPHETLWVEVDGVHDATLIAAIAHHAGASALMVEDILHPGARPRVEVTSETLFLLLRSLQPRIRGEETPLVAESLAILRQPRRLISFQEAAGDTFGALRGRLATDRGLRARGVDGILHGLIDAVVDDDLEALDALEVSVDHLEDAAVRGRDRELIPRFLHVKDDLNTVRAALAPVRAAVLDLKRGVGAVVAPSELAYLADVADHLDAAVDQLDALRERASTALELNLAVLNQTMNEVTRLLTVVSTIFLPLTFIVGVYGMNFSYMPELASPYGYPAVVLTMLTLTATLVGLFRRWRWL